ncbi:hypothetical protein Pfo_028011 [Paulownia fortunei]|nr:hypothetical protein Pfo_028011 [Paulownia fortunei]
MERVQLELATSFTSAFLVNLQHNPSLSLSLSLPPPPRKLIYIKRKGDGNKALRIVSASLLGALFYQGGILKMDEVQEMEWFGMDNDYEDSQWIGGEFYGKRRQKPAQTKDDVLYGVFASGDSDSDSYDGSGSKKRRKDPSKKTDYTKPVNFVSTGSAMPNQEINRNSKEVKEVIVEDDLRPVGLGLGASAGLGFGSASSKNANHEEGYAQADKDDDYDFLPTAFGKKIKEGAQLRREKEKEKSMLAKKSSQAEGGGLGKNEQGILAPVEAKMRPKDMGMGFNDYKEASRPALQESDEKPMPHQSQPSEGRTKEKLWSKQAMLKKKVFITAEELLLKKQEQGPQVRVLTNLENLNAEEKARENDVPMPGLQHNVRLIVDLAELDIQKLDRDLRNERETVVALQREKEKLPKEVYHHKQQLDNMEEIMSVLDQIGEKSIAGTLALESLAKSFMDLQTRFLDDYSLCNLSCIACSYALPLFARIFRGWDPLQNQTHGVEVVSPWKKLLHKDSFNLSDTASPYAQLLMEVVFPVVRISGTNTWQARDPEPMLRFLESWEELLPPPVLRTILDSVVMPKLSAAVDSWDPCKETIPIRSWILPWLPLLGQKLENCYHITRNRLASALHAWHPGDMSAYYILSPWKSVFDPASWEQLMVRYIIPKLLAVMHDFQINPANQKLDQFYWLMDVFFNKWQEVLYHWLCSSPNFEEANEHIQYRLNLGLDMMNQAVEGLEVIQPGLKENISYLRVSEQRQFETQKKVSVQAQQRAFAGLGNGIHAEGISGGLDMSLKEVIEIHAQQNGLLFKPKPGRNQGGHQIYGFGNISIIINSLNQEVFAQTDDRWSLVTLEQLLELNNHSSLKNAEFPSSS